MAKSATRIRAPKSAAEPRRAAVVTKAASVKTRQYVADQPDTRVPALLLLFLYPLGSFPFVVGWSPLLLVAFAPLVAGPAWLAVRKGYGDCRYTRIVTLTAGLVPVWLAVAAHTGVFRGSVLLGYTVGAVALWWAYVRCEVLTERRALRQGRIDWADFAPKVGLQGSGLRETTDTRLGRQYKIDVLGTGKRTSQIATPALGETWAMHRSLSSDARVVVQPDPKNARQILVEERTHNPWQEPNGHPTLVGEESEWQLPAVRSIHDGPLEIGADPSTGRLLALPVYVDRSCRHVLVIATTGGGKTVCISCLVERITACTDTLVWAVDTTKGTLSGLWRDAIDWGAGVGEHQKALAILRAAKTVIEERSKLSDGENHYATQAAPLIFLLVDEAGSMQGSMSARQASEYRDLLGFVFRSARSAGVVMVFISQRGVIQHTGSGDTRANADLRVCGRVKSPGEMEYAIPDWQASGFPDMSKYAEGYAGVIAIDGPGVPPMTGGRTWDLSDFPTVRELARKRGAPTARLEPAIASKLGESYADRRRVLVAAGAVPAPAAEEVDTIDKEFQDIVKSVQITERAAAELAAMQIPEAERVPLADLIAVQQGQEAANKRAEVPDSVRDPVLRALKAAGAAGVSRAELVRLLTPMSESSVKRALAAMRDQGMVVGRGATSNARYVLPEC